MNSIMTTRSGILGSKLCTCASYDRPQTNNERTRAKSAFSPSIVLRDHVRLMSSQKPNTDAWQALPYWGSSEGEHPASKHWSITSWRNVFGRCYLMGTAHNHNGPMRHVSDWIDQLLNIIDIFRPLLLLLTIPLRPWPLAVITLFVALSISVVVISTKSFRYHQC